jgi:molybdopterin-guanine dinucleotide biosynthesis protein A
MNTLPAYILAGGQSSRFGSDKALASLHGKPLIQRIAEAAASRCQPITAIGHRLDEYKPLGLRTIVDTIPDCGPMGGLHAALQDACDHCWLLLLSCDLLQLQSHWIDALLDARTECAPAVAYRHDGRWQPLLALYQTSLIDEVRSRLATHRFAMHRLLDDIACVHCPLPADWPDILQVNDEASLNAWSSSSAHAISTPVDSRES